MNLNQQISVLERRILERSRNTDLQLKATIKTIRNEVGEKLTSPSTVLLAFAVGFISNHLSRPSFKIGSIVSLLLNVFKK